MKLDTKRMTTADFPEGADGHAVLLTGWRAVPPPAITWRGLLAQMSDDEARIRILVQCKYEVVDEHLSQVSALQWSPLALGGVLLAPGNSITVETPEGWKALFEARRLEYEDVNRLIVDRMWR